MQPKRLTILGIGLLGGSIGLAVRSAVPGCRIIGYGHRPQTLSRAIEIGAIDASQTDPAVAVADADLVILCTPVGVFEDLLKQIAGALKPDCLVTDVGSTKRMIARVAEQTLPTTVHFVPSHPMAGSEKRGVEFARADLFKNALCIVTPTPKTHVPAIAEVEKFWHALGMRTIRLDPQTHDRLVADISHLPHVLAAILVAMQEDAALDLCGKGFLDATRIASGDGELWRDILIQNKDNVGKGIVRLTTQLNNFLRLLDPTRADALKDWLNDAAHRRETLLQQKLREMNPD